MLSTRKLYVRIKTDKQKDAVKAVADKMGLDVRFCEPVSYEKAFENGILEDAVLSNDMHIFNHETILSLKEMGYKRFSFIGSYELTRHEWRELCTSVTDPDIVPVLPVYGRVPVMESANCVKKTTGGCDHSTGFYEIIDRKKVHFPVYSECEHKPHCRNIIYNSVPTSLLGLYEKDWNGAVFFDFTTESAGEVGDIFRDFLAGHHPDGFKFTRGHYNKGVL